MKWPLVIFSALATILFGVLLVRSLFVQDAGRIYLGGREYNFLTLPGCVYVTIKVDLGTASGKRQQRFWHEAIPAGPFYGSNVVPLVGVQAHQVNVQVPYWLPMLLSASPLVWMAWRRWRRRNDGRGFPVAGVDG